MTWSSYWANIRLEAIGGFLFFEIIEKGWFFYPKNAHWFWSFSTFDFNFDYWLYDWSTLCILLVGQMVDRVKWWGFDNSAIILSWWYGLSPNRLKYHQLDFNITNSIIISPTQQNITNSILISPTHFDITNSEYHQLFHQIG